MVSFWSVFQQAHNLTHTPVLVLAVADHFMWFNYFSNRYHTFWEISTHFGIFVWLVPFMFFVSLSANENVLPLAGGFRMSEASQLFAKTDNIPSCEPTDPNASRSSSFLSSPTNTSPPDELRISRSRSGRKKNLLKSFLDFFAKQKDGMLPHSSRDADFGKQI